MTTGPGGSPMGSPIATLVLLRHGSSLSNEDGRFGGWEDVGLSPAGIEQARAAGRRLKEMKLDFHLAATSVLRRAIWTLWHCLDALEQPWAPTVCDWRLNERHYGALQGMNRVEAASLYGDEQVRLWRRGFSHRPPMLAPGDVRDSFGDPPYQALGREEVPLGESLQDTQTRVAGCWNERIKPALLRRESVLVAAHGNSIRAMVMWLEGIGEEQIARLEIEHAQPMVYDLMEGGAFKRRGDLFKGDHLA